MSKGGTSIRNARPLGRQHSLPTAGSRVGARLVQPQTPSSLPEWTSQELSALWTAPAMGDRQNTAYWPSRERAASSVLCVLNPHPAQKS